MLLGALLGVGTAALNFVVEAAAHKKIAHTPGNRTQGESVGVQLQIADAALGLQTAQLHARSVTEFVIRHADAGSFPDGSPRPERKPRAATRCERSVLRSTRWSMFTDRVGFSMQAPCGAWPVTSPSGRGTPPSTRLWATNCSARPCSDEAGQEACATAQRGH